MALTQESWRSSFLLALDNDLLFTKISSIALPDIFSKNCHICIYNDNIIIYNIIYDIIYNMLYDNISCIMYNVFAWTRVATSEHPVEVDPANLIIVFKMMPIINILTT